MFNPQYQQMMYNGQFQQQQSPTQFRLNQMEQLYPQYNPMQMNQPQQMQVQQNGQVLKGRPVTSFDEAKASQIDFDGSIFLFPDLANGKIYTKQINLDGTASFKEYILDAKEEEKKEIKSEVKTEVDKDTIDLISDMQEQIDELKEQLKLLKGGNKHGNESNANSRND